MGDSEYPAHHPLHGVDLPSSSIEHIISLALPALKVVSVTALPKGRSYNNKIYFIKTISAQSETDHNAESANEFVLKLNGQYFGADKIQNEVCCLWLLEKYCKRVPAPRIVAWSEDGKLLRTLSDGVLKCTGIPSDNNRGWVLITRVPGDPVQPQDLGPAERTSLAVQLAEIVADWRLNIPPQHHCGNVRFQPSQGFYDGAAMEHIVCGGRSDPATLELTIGGLIGNGVQPPHCLSSAEQYHKVLTSDKLSILKTDATYARNSHLAPSLQRFVSDTLPNLELVAGPAGDKFILTHYDLSPRNILVSGSPPVITGIVDFEFAGFFPETEEFVSDHVGNKDDIPGDMYAAYTRHLEKLGVATPGGSLDERIWHQAHQVGILATNVAPWWLPGGLRGEELAAELDEAGDRVSSIIEDLDSAVRTKP